MRKIVQLRWKNEPDAQTIQNAAKDSSWGKDRNRMKSRPIDLSAEEVRAVLAGSKTQMMRILKGFTSSSKDIVPAEEVCPFGQVGDRLWCREAFAPFIDATTREYGVIYEADDKGLLPDQRWKSPILLLRKYSRITLEITKIELVRVQNISNEDVIAQWLYDRYDAFKVRREWNKRYAKQGYGWNTNPWAWKFDHFTVDTDKANR